MQSSVKPACVELLRLRRRVLTVLGLGVWAGGVVTSCKSTTEPSEGLVTAPMLPAGEAIAVIDDAGDAGSEGSVSARVMVEPRPPSGTSGCTRDVQCSDPLDAVPAWPYPKPFERCDPDPPGDAGRLSARETTERRQSDPDTCCYVNYRDCARRSSYRPNVVRGRPLRDEIGTPLVAATRASDTWAGGWSALAPRRGEGDEWLRAAALEHASVAEFARLSLALMALGAPADLLQATHSAALDEIEHARICYAQASRRLGHAVGPGPLPVERAPQLDVPRLARDTLLDGCLGECVAALVLREHGERDADARAELLRMASDEERHAELAWKILEFLLAVEPRATADGIAAAIAQADALATDELATGVLREVVRPCARELVARYSG